MSTSSPQKSASSSQNLAGGPDFASWSPMVLTKFAQDSYAKMREQEDQLEQLRQDLKTALEAYRALLRL
jgi:uncharacterized protein YgfB (UPF0149 family)